MTNLDSIFKSRDITLPTKVRLGKVMVFPVVMYGYESWIVKKAECRRTDADIKRKRTFREVQIKEVQSDTIALQVTYRKIQKY